MINNSALSMTMDVAQIAPKAATVQPSRGDGAFGEALAGAQSVHDRSESREAAAPPRRDWAQSDATADKTTGQERAAEVRRSSSDRPDRTDQTGAADEQVGDSTDDTGPVTDAASTDATGNEASEGTGEATVTATTDPDPDPDADAAVDATSDVTVVEAAVATLAVAAAPVQGDVDAIIVPTTTQASVQVTSDAVDAAIRMTIDVDAAANVPTQVAGTDVGAADVAPTQVAATVQGAEDATDDDAQAGPTSPSASRSTAASGPSPVQLAAATFSDADEAAAATPTEVRGVAIAAAATTDVAEGDAPDATAQLVQAAVVDEPDGAGDADVDLPANASKVAKATTGSESTSIDVDVAEADVPEAVQAAKLNQQQAPTVSAAAQHQAAVQAKAAEQASEEGGDAAPPKLESLPAQASSTAAAVREGSNGIRVREGLLSAHQQQRIDHIAEQLATRLRLSHAAGGSQVQLSLKPRELGDVTVQMQVREGVVAATILVDKADTARTIQSSIDDLRRSLEQQGLSIQEFSVDVRGEAGAGGANARAAADLRRNATGTSHGSSSSVAGAASVMPGYDGDDAVTADDVHDGDVSVLA